MLDAKNLVYSLLIYLASGILGMLTGLANAIYVAPIVSFCIPFAIVKVYGEKIKLTASVKTEDVCDDPFDDGAKVFKLQVKPKMFLGKVIRWILYYVLLEIGLALTVLCAYLFARPVFDAMVQNTWFYVVLAVMQFAPLPYDLLMSGCLKAAFKVLNRAIKP